MLVTAKLVVVPWKALNCCRVVEPKTKNWPVVVAPALIVKPEAVVLLPIVDEAKEYIPPLKPMREVVALWVPKSEKLENGKAKLA